MLAPAKYHQSLRDVRLPTPGEELFDRISERIQAHHTLFQNVAPEYFSEITEFGFYGTGGNAWRHKARPYENWESLMQVQRLGHMLRNHSIAGKAILENLTSYTIGKGITFTAKAKKRYRKNAATRRQVERIQDIINQFVSDECWPSVQEETLRDRVLSAGEVFRQWEPVGTKLDYAFVDSHEVAPPTTLADHPWGITYEGGNVKRPEAYYVGDSPLPASMVQHWKIGVDSRDPRGVPLLWCGYVSAKEIDELDYAATQSGLGYSKHTVIKEYNDDVDARDVAEVANNSDAADKRAKELNKLNAGGSEYHAVGHTVKGLAAAWNSSGFIDLIDFKSRHLASLASIPEFIVTGKADTGSRNTLISAEAPLTRRVERMGDRLAKYDVEFLWQVVAAALRRYGDIAWLEEIKQRISLVPEIPTPDGRDSIAKQQSIVELVREGLLDPISAIRQLGHDPEEVMEGKQQWSEMESALLDELRDAGRANDLYDVEELRMRVDTVAALITIGFTEDEALLRVGLDQIEDREALDNAIEMRQQMLDLSRTEPAEPDDDETNDDDSSNPEA